MKTIAIYCWNLLVFVAMAMSIVLTVAFWIGFVVPIRLAKMAISHLRE